jgi:signal peptide peptidase SppA
MQDDEDDKPAEFSRRPYQVYEPVPGVSVAVIPIAGVLYRGFSSKLYDWGITSTDVLERHIAQAAMDDQIHGILLHVDSPGGVIWGTPEAARAVRKAQELKPVIAYADGLMCSAAYWIASQATGVYATESADIGSIGVYIALLDESRAAEMAGVHVEMFTSGKFKGAGYPGTTLTLDHRNELQDSVNETHEQFKAAVRSGRASDIPDVYMQGKTFPVSRALDASLIDGMADFDGAVEALIGVVQHTRAGRIRLRNG